ncbi:hypothetical protein K502DRAFT_326876 [Neoconidiobolus thromboides FSU 785]|nr:hypothetical protein K502DRAFT_326876 [Neoconidiobolus thromboides FSU 785]
MFGQISPINLLNTQSPIPPLNNSFNEVAPVIYNVDQILNEACKITQQAKTYGPNPLGSEQLVQLCQKTRQLVQLIVQKIQQRSQMAQNQMLDQENQRNEQHAFELVNFIEQAYNISKDGKQFLAPDQFIQYNEKLHNSLHRAQHILHKFQGQVNCCSTDGKAPCQFSQVAGCACCKNSPCHCTINCECHQSNHAFCGQPAAFCGAGLNQGGIFGQVSPFQNQNFTQSPLSQNSPFNPIWSQNSHFGI